MPIYGRFKFCLHPRSITARAIPRKRNAVDVSLESLIKFNKARQEASEREKLNFAPAHVTKDGRNGKKVKLSRKLSAVGKGKAEASERGKQLKSE
jgi:hypothetical protein